MSRKHVHFDSFGLWVDEIRDTPDEGESHCRGNKEWSGTSSFEEAIEFATTGQPELVSRLMVHYDQIHTNLSEPVNGYRPDVEGLFFDVGQVIQDVPESWYQEKPVSEKPVIQVWANMGCDSGVDQEEFSMRGAAIVACIDMLAYEYIVELVVGKGLGNAFDYDFTIDFSTTPLDIDALAFALVNPATNRRLFFAALEKWEGTRNAQNEGYGRSINWSREIVPDDALEFKCINDIPSEERRKFRDAKTSAEWVKDKVKNFAEQRCGEVTTF